MEVYCVMNVEEEYGYYLLAGIFSTEEKAINWINAEKAKQEFYQSKYVIVRSIVD